MSTRESPERNSVMMASRSFWGMSPCMAETVKLAWRILLVSQSTFFFVLQKMTACVIVSVSYRSHSVSNFHSSRSTATKNCLMPSSVSSSRLTRMRTGSVINLRCIDEQDVGIKMLLRRLLYRFAFDECAELLEVWNTLVSIRRSTVELRVNTAISQS